MDNNIPQVDIWTDGACLSNPGPGGWASKLISKSRSKLLQGGAIGTTNNRMELTAVIEGLSALKIIPCEVNIYSDSKYVVDAFNQHWIDSWQRDGWRTSNSREVKNSDLWMELIALVRKHYVHFHWVKGHANNYINNEVDQIANQQAHIHSKKKADLENYDSSQR